MTKIPSNTEAEKQMRERLVFQKFMMACDLTIDPNGIESRSPPEPDILYTSLNGEKIAFELTEMCSEEIAEAISKDLRKDLRSEDFTYVRTSDPSVRILTDKLSKTYASEYPIELLCYTNGRTVSPDSFVIERVRYLLRLDKGQFRRIWFWGKEVHLLYDICDGSAKCS